MKARTLRTAAIVALVVALVPLQAEAQKKRKKKPKNNDGVDIVALYQKGSYGEAAAAGDERRAAGKASAEELYVVGLAYQALNNNGSATSAYVALVESRPEEDAWHWVGESARALVVGDVGVAMSASARALEIDGGNKYAHYQRGLALSHQHAYQPAAEAFVRLLEIDGNFAYGHYYAALSYYQVRSLVAATNHFERFLELAPDAPERIQVEGALAALRGS